MCAVHFKSRMSSLLAGVLPKENLLTSLSMKNCTRSLICGVCLPGFPVSSGSRVKSFALRNSPAAWATALWDEYTSSYTFSASLSVRTLSLYLQSASNILVCSFLFLPIFREMPSCNSDFVSRDQRHWLENTDDKSDCLHCDIVLFIQSHFHYPFLQKHVALVREIFIATIFSFKWVKTSTRETTFWRVMYLESVCEKLQLWGQFISCVQRFQTFQAAQTNISNLLKKKTVTQNNCNTATSQCYCSARSYRHKVISVKLTRSYMVHPTYLRYLSSRNIVGYLLIHRPISCMQIDLISGWVSLQARTSMPT